MAPSKRRRRPKVSEFLPDWDRGKPVEPDDPLAEDEDDDGEDYTDPPSEGYRAGSYM